MATLAVELGEALALGARGCAVVLLDDGPLGSFGRLAGEPRVVEDGGFLVVTDGFLTVAAVECRLVGGVLATGLDGFADVAVEVDLPPDARGRRDAGLGGWGSALGFALSLEVISASRADGGCPTGVAEFGGVSSGPSGSSSLSDVSDTRGARVGAAGALNSAVVL